MELNLNEQEQNRRNSLQQIRDLGINPYPAPEYEITATSRQVLEGFNPDAAENDPSQQVFKAVSMAGRLMSRRIMGAASFIELQDSEGRIQAYVKRDEICPGEDKTLYNTVFKKLLDIGDFLPYDLSQDVCEITPDDFGLFWTDALDNAPRYNGKKVKLTGQAVTFREFKGKAFALQRQAYTCCSADIGQIHLLCFYDIKPGFPVGQWLKVTGTVRFFEDNQNGQKIQVPCLEVTDYAITSKPETEIIYFS